MGRQSSRIWLANNTDHKEMVTWNGSGFQYHDKAYIWNGNTFELVWQKLYDLRLLYESTLLIKPVSSENNKYLYFTEGTDTSVIYRIEVNDKNPEKEAHYTSDKYTDFSAPISSRGIGIYRAPQSSAYSPYDYEILDLETGGIGEVDTFDFYEETGMYPERYTPPTLTNQEVSPAESGMGHNYASVFQIMNWGATYQPWNYITFVAITGISAMVLDNREGTGTLINERMTWDMGRLSDGGPRGLLPRFLVLTLENDFKIIEFGAGTSHGLYSATVTSTPPFTPKITHLTVSVKFGVMRNGKLPIVAESNRLWFVVPDTDSISYTDTGIDIPDARIWDVSPDHKYVLTFMYTQDWVGQALILDINTGKTIVNINDELFSKDGFIISNAYFVGHKCIFVEGYIDNFVHRNNYRCRLYKWR